MSYTNSPACQLLETFCACCSRPLVDATSVEVGVGPECRKRHGFAAAEGPADWAAVNAAVASLQLGAGWVAASGDQRKAANVLTAHIAADHASDDVGPAIAALAALGYHTLSAKCAKNLCAVTIEQNGGVFRVSAPYSDAATADWRRIPGRRWNREAKTNEVPASERRALWSLLQAHYAGLRAMGPKGAFRIA